MPGTKPRHNGVCEICEKKALYQKDESQAWWPNIAAINAAWYAKRKAGRLARRRKGQR